MTVALVLVLVAVVIGGALALALRGAARRSASPPSAAAPATRIRPVLADFHVRGESAHVQFAVPLTEGAVDRHLRTVLEHEAVAVLREKRDHGLPLDGVEAIIVYGERSGERVEVGRVELPSAGMLPEVVAADLLPHDRVAGFDPLAALGEQKFDVVPGVTVREAEGALPPVHEAVELPGPLEVALRAQGIDPGAASLPDLVLGLLQASGYQVTPEGTTLASAGAGSSSVSIARRGGSASLLVIVEHRAGDHPELSERAINEAIVIASRHNMGGFVVTDMYGPYLIYEKERRSKLRFITRERLQAFVDSFALGS